MSKARNLSLLSTVEAGATTDQTKADLNAIGVSGGRKNIIINGGFDVWQRGGGSFTGGYSADRFKVSGVSSVDQNTTGSPTGFTNNLRVYRSVSGTSVITQRIESEAATSLVGKAAACSFYYSLTSGAVSSIDVNLSYATAKNNFSSVTSIQTINISSPTSATVLEALFSALPANAANGIELNFSYNTSSSSDVRLSRVQLELGSVATDFEHRSYGEELALCQRYYASLTGSAGAYGTALAVIGSTNAYGVIAVFPVTMRTIPTCAALGTWFVHNYSGSARTVSAISLHPSTNQVSGQFTTTGLTTGYASLPRFNDTHTITADAEL